jgi:hypothetical protein
VTNFGDTTASSSGQNIVLWTTGLGADPTDSDTNYTSTPHAVNTPLQIYIGGIPATILYQGSAGYRWISLAAVAGGLLSNIATLPSNSGGGACFDPVNNLYGNEIAPPNQHTLRTGLVTLVQGTSTKDVIRISAAAAFESYAGVFGPVNSVSPGGCTRLWRPALKPGFHGDLDGRQSLLRGRQRHLHINQYSGQLRRYRRIHLLR